MQFGVGIYCPIVKAINEPGEIRAQVEILLTSFSELLVVAEQFHSLMVLIECIISGG